MVSLRAPALFVVSCLSACSGGDLLPDAGPDAATAGDADRDQATDGGPDGDPDGDRDGDVEREADADEGPRPPYVPAEARAELIFSGPTGVATPPTWNANLPKLVSDGRFYYAVHTHFTEDVAGRFAAILRRPVAGGAWVEVARISSPHQPPGLALDAGERLHLAFDCLRPAGADVQCFQGGAGTGGLGSRFYHLVFSARDEAGALRFDTYANFNEWTAHSNGYLGLGTTAAGLTFWSLADEGWGRVVQFMDSASGVGTITTLRAPAGYFLYPLMSGPPTGTEELIVYAGEFDPAGGNNAAYVASQAWVGGRGGLRELVRRAPAVAEPGATNAFPSDLSFDRDGTLLLLSYLPDPATGGCTELLRFDAGLAEAPTVLTLGCLETYAKLQVASSGVYYVLSSGGGASFRLGVSDDRGESWRWNDVPIVGLEASDDVRFFGATPLGPQAAPTAYDPDVLRFFFSGADSAGLARRSYLGELLLAEP